jgi:hypothetical protein
MYLNKRYPLKKTSFCHNSETLNCASTLNAYPPNLKKSKTLKLLLGYSYKIFGYVYLSYINNVLFFFKISQPCEKMGWWMQPRIFLKNRKNSPYVDGKI